MEKYREITLIDTTMMMMGWDLETHMPPKGLGLRSDQLGLLERLRHRMLTSEGLAGLLDESEKEETSDEVRSRNLYLVRREREIAVSVPEELVAALATQVAVSRDTWAKAKGAKDWGMFEPELEKVVDLSVKRAEATMDARGAACVFDAMIDDLERGMKSEQAAGVLSDLRRALVPLADKFSEASKDVDSSRIKPQVPLDVQREVVKDAVGLLGYDTTSGEARGRIDETAHPFTVGYIDDVRIALRYTGDGLIDTMMGAMHEAGHALYGQNINHEWMYQPVSNAASMGVHESMSRFAENMIGTSRPFWNHYLPRLKQLTGTAFSGVSVDDLLRCLNKVERSKIRVKADEVTYCLHIAIRFEIERALFSGKTTVKELPQMWNDMYDKYLQVEIEDDAEGVLQDVHWSEGYFGYFQSYALGNVYDGMYLERLGKDLPEWPREVEAGRPGVVLGWLRDNVQRHGALYDPAALVERVTGKSLTSEPFVKYLEKKHSALWD
jgi:carboxypeptidase Taq